MTDPCPPKGWILLLTRRADPLGSVRIKALQCSYRGRGVLTDDPARAQVYLSRAAAEAVGRRVRLDWCATVVPAWGPLGSLAPAPKPEGER